MTQKKPDLHMLTVWRVRLLFLAVIPSFLSAYFSARRGLGWWLFTIGWAAAFLYLYIFYYPIKYKKLSYRLGQRSLLIGCGVIYTRLKAVPLESIQYVSLATTPLQRLFGVCSLLVYCAGSTACLPGLLPRDAEELRQALLPELSEGGGSVG